MEYLLKLSPFTEEELLVFKELSDKNIFTYLEEACELYENNIFPTNNNWDTMNKVLDLAFLLNVVDKFIFWYEDWMSQFIGIYIHTTDDTEYYHSTLTLKEVEYENKHEGCQRQMVHGEDYSTKKEIKHVCDYNEFYKSVIFDVIKDNFKYIHIYTFRFLHNTLHFIPIILTTKIPKRRLIEFKIKDNDMVFTHNQKIREKYFGTSYIKIDYDNCFGDLIIDINIYTNNKCTIKPNIFTHRFCDIIENASGYIPLIQLKYGLVQISTHNCAYIEYTYCTINDIDDWGKLRSTESMILNGKAVGDGLNIVNYKPMIERQKCVLSNICLDNRSSDWREGCPEKKYPDLDKKSPEEINEIFAKEGYDPIIMPNETIIDEIFNRNLQYNYKNNLDVGYLLQWNRKDKLISEIMSLNNQASL